MSRRRLILFCLVTLAVVGLAVLAAEYRGGRSHSNSSDVSRSPEPRPVARFEPEFPRSALVEGLLDAPVELACGLFEPEYVFGQGPDGSSALWQIKDGTWTALGQGLAPQRKFSIDEEASSLAWTNFTDGVSLRFDDGTLADAGFVSAIRADGSPAWEWRFPSSNDHLRAYCWIYGDRGPVGMALAFGGETGLVGLSLSGDVLWQVPKDYVIYDVVSHPGLPGHLLRVGGNALLLDSTASRGEPRKLLGGVEAPGRFDADMYVTAGCLFPDGGGQPAIVLLGTSLRQAPVMVRVDAAGRTIWRAVLPSAAEGLGLVEPENGPRLIVTATRGGEVIVLGDDGTLYASMRMPGTSDERETTIYGLSTGELRPGVWGVHVELLKRQFVYRLHPQHISAR